MREWERQKQRPIDRAPTPGEDIEFDKVRVIQPAVATEQINKYERWAIAGIGGLAALALTCYGVALIEFRRRRLNGPTDIDEGLGIRVLGVLAADVAQGARRQQPGRHPSGRGHRQRAGDDHARLDRRGRGRW